jgi:glycosyltransferase involved in cell wall biosynthesis
MISIIIPAYNEEKYIGRTIEALKKLPLIDEIIVVDDGSTDKTSSAADNAGAIVLRLHQNKGKGAALAEGFLHSKGDILVFLDADLGETAGQTLRLIQPILDNQADMTIAQFPVLNTRKGGFGFVVRLARWGIHKYTGLSMNSPLSGQRAMRRDVMKKIGNISDGFGVEVGLTIDASRYGFRIIETPTTMTHRLTGQNTRDVWHRYKQFVAVAKTLLQKRHP